MKIASCIILLLSLAVVKAEDLTHNQKLEFVQFYRDWSNLAKEFPKYPQVEVLFVDINADGVPEALATSRGSTYETGSDWTFFRKVGDKWSPIQGVDPHTKEIRPLFAPFGRSDEFYFIYEGNAESHAEIVIIHKDYDKLAPDGEAPAKVERIVADPKGILRIDPVSSLDKLIAYSKKFKALERLKSERFD